MLRKERSTPATDDGWVYGTLQPDGEVTSAGRGGFLHGLPHDAAGPTLPARQALNLQDIDIARFVYNALRRNEAETPAR